MTKKERREIFKRVVSHLLKQGKKSTDNRHCMYRGHNGTMCAVGCLIDDEHYSVDIENESLDDVSNAKIAVEKSIGKTLNAEDMGMLQALQRTHDVYDVEDWRSRLGKIATEDKLV